METKKYTENVPVAISCNDETTENVPVAISCHRETITKSDLDEMVRQVNENWGKAMPYIVDYESFVVPPTYDLTRGLHHDDFIAQSR